MYYTDLHYSVCVTADVRLRPAVKLRKKIIRLPKILYRFSVGVPKRAMYTYITI